MKCLLSAKNFVNMFSSKGANKALAAQRQQAEKFVSTISEDTWQSMSKMTFAQKGECPSQFLECLQMLRKYITENGVTLSSEVSQALELLERKAGVFAERLNNSVSKGIEPLNYGFYGLKFQKNNKKAFNVLNDFLKKECFSFATKPHNSTNDKIVEQLMTIDRSFSNAIGNALFNSKIVQLSDNILQPGQIFYHGTKRAKAIKKHGFSLLPKKLQAIMGARELGEAVYLTPDKNVAARFAGLRGNIMHLKVNLDKVAVVNDMQLHELQKCIIRQLGENLDSHTLELVIKGLFKRNGYNAVYTSQALGNFGIFAGEHGVANDILCGGKQTQLAVFNPDDITILTKTFKERLKNQIKQTDTFIKMPIRYVKMLRECSPF